MAKVPEGISTTADPTPELYTGFELQFLDTLGSSAGPEAYLHMTAIIEILNQVPDPALVDALEQHIAENGINRELIVVESSRSIFVANNPEDAKHLRREVLYRKVVQLGATILRAPQ